jgi:outer membrane protein TolC
VGRAVAGNPDVRTALSRLREARASVSSARAPLTPTVDVTGTVRSSGGGKDVPTTTTYTLGFDAAWELDVFGGIRSAIDAATATAEAREAWIGRTSSSASPPKWRWIIDIRSHSAD